VRAAGRVGDVEHCRCERVVGEVGVPPAAREEVLVAMQPVDLAVRFRGPVILDEDCEAFPVDVAGEGGVWLRAVRPAARYPETVVVTGLLRCRRRDSNPRHADYDSAALTD
jgi:hypothetical protein